MDVLLTQMRDEGSTDKGHSTVEVRFNGKIQNILWRYPTVFADGLTVCGG